MPTPTDPTRTSDARPADQALNAARARLRQALVAYFSNDDLDNLCFDLGVDSEYRLT